MKKFSRLAFILILLAAFAMVQVFKPNSTSTTAVAEMIVAVSGEMSAGGKAHVLPPSIADVDATVRLMKRLAEMEPSHDRLTTRFLNLTPEQIQLASSLLVVKSDQSSFFLQIREPSA